MLAFIIFPLSKVNMETMLKKIVEYDYERVSYVKMSYNIHGTHIKKFKTCIKFVHQKYRNKVK